MQDVSTLSMVKVVLHAPQEVPETGLGDDLIGRKDAHAEDLGRGVLLGWQMAADDLVFLERHLEGKQSVKGHPTAA